MTMNDAVRNVLANYATFQGRARRPEFWWWVLFVFLVQMVTNLIDQLLIRPALGFAVWDTSGGQPLSFLVAIVLILPNLAVGARRLHDIGRTGWWLFIALVPIIGVLVLIYFFVQPSEADNAYGPEPDTG